MTTPAQVRADGEDTYDLIDDALGSSPSATAPGSATT